MMMENKRHATCSERGEENDAHKCDNLECACSDNSSAKTLRQEAATVRACPECGCPIGAGETVCPECACPIGDTTVECPECGCPIGAGETVCSECACPIGDTTVECPECGCPIEDGEAVCPECACPIGSTKEVCPECGTSYDVLLSECPVCACPNDAVQTDAPAVACDSQQTTSDASVARSGVGAVVARNADYALSVLRTMRRVIMMYDDFSGRSRRSEFWTFIVFNCMVGFVLYLALFANIGRDYVAVTEASTTGEYWRRLLYTCVVDHLFMTVLVVVYVLLAFLPLLSVTVRRLHDTNRSGFWVLLAVIPFVFGPLFDMSPYAGCIPLSVMLLLDSVPDNRWGVKLA